MSFQSIRSPGDGHCHRWMRPSSISHGDASRSGRQPEVRNRAGEVSDLRPCKVRKSQELAFLTVSDSWSDQVPDLGFLWESSTTRRPSSSIARLALKIVPLALPVASHSLIRSFALQSPWGQASRSGTAIALSSFSGGRPPVFAGRFLGRGEIEVASSIADRHPRGGGSLKLPMTSSRRRSGWPGSGLNIFMMPRARPSRRRPRVSCPSRDASVP